MHRTAFETTHIKPLCNYENRLDTTPEPVLKMECLEAFYDLNLNGKIVETDYHYIKANETRQEGLVTYIDIGHLEKGMHDINVIYNFWEDTASFAQNVATVEFYKSSTAIRPDTAK